MPGAAPDAAESGSLRRGAFTYCPVVPGRVEFAVEVRRRILSTRPAVVAIELPEQIAPELLQACARLPAISAIVYPDPLDENASIYVLTEPADPFVEAVRSARETGAQILWLDPATGERPHLAGDYPDPYALRYLGLDRYVDQYRLHPPARNDETALHASRLAWKLQGADPFAPTLIVLSLNLLDPVLDAMQEPQPEPARRVEATGPAHLVHPAPACLAEICVETPYQQARYEQWRTNGGEHLTDRGRTQLALLKEAEAAYEQSTGDRVVHWHRRALSKYTRNLAHVSGYLVASLFELAVAARSIVDDNYAWEVWATANHYAPQQAPTSLDIVNLSADEIWLDTRKIRLRRRLPRPKQRVRPATLKPRPHEPVPGDWAVSPDQTAICSYPPEDLVIENYGRFLKAKAKSVLSEERERVQPFTTSLLDGIDIRETIRHWHERKIFVRESARVAGGFGAVVVIFDEDRDNRYTYLTTWLGEHQNESDMAYYSTQPFDHLVGPGMGRAEYGGFLMTMPPKRMYDIWNDPDYDFAETKAERLLMAALDYSVDRHVVYVAAKPPRGIFRSIAAQLNRKIVYLPSGALNSSQLKRVRVVHVLDSHARRDTAKDYLW